MAGIISGLVLYQFCVGINRPSMGLLRSIYIPNESMKKKIFYNFIIFIYFFLVRSTMMSYLRVPQIILILTILLTVSC